MRADLGGQAEYFGAATCGEWSLAMKEAQQDGYGIFSGVTRLDRKLPLYGQDTERGDLAPSR